MMDGKDITDKSLDEFLTTLHPEAMNWRPVEFRCMIQDILGNELYSKHNSDKLGDRTIFYCITVPGENEWVRSSPAGHKNEFMTNNGQLTRSSELSSRENANETSSNGERTMRLSSYLVNWSFPIPSDGKNRSSLIKIYDIKLVEYLRVNDIVQVSGLIEPAEFEDDSQLMTNKNSPNSANNLSPNGSNQNENSGTLHDPSFEPASDFPHRLVPRVHVRRLKKLKHINPLLPDIVSRDQIDVAALKMARARLSNILTPLLGDDSLASEYLIISLISRVHRRNNAAMLGQFTLGLSNFKPEMKFLVEKLYEIISKITTHSHYIDMTIANLNNLRFTPTKDHVNNKMIAGTLQLPDGLYLVLNETALSEGLLNSQGTENLTTLSQIIRSQRHDYDFKFHSVQIDTDLKILVIGEGKSLLPVPTTVPLDKNDDETIKSMRQACESVNDFLTEDLLNMFRYYITALIDVPEYKIPDEVSKIVEADFAERRAREDANGQALFSCNDLSSHLTLARYLTLSRGETTLTPEIWKETCLMELNRISRLRRARI